MLVRHHVVGIVAADAEYLVYGPSTCVSALRETRGDGPDTWAWSCRHGPGESGRCRARSGHAVRPASDTACPASDATSCSD